MAVAAVAFDLTPSYAGQSDARAFCAHSGPSKPQIRVGVQVNASPAGTIRAAAAARRSDIRWRYADCINPATATAAGGTRRWRAANGRQSPDTCTWIKPY